MLRAVANIPNYIGADTYANIVANWPAASYSGMEVYATDLGANGTRLRSNGTRWRPLNGVAVMAILTAGGAYNNSETIALQTRFPAGYLTTGDVIRTYFSITKSGSTDNGNVTGRIGTAGTTADTVITGFSANTVLGAANLSGGFIWDVQIASATTALKIGLGSGANGSYTGAANAAAPAATTISNVSNSLYFNFAALSSSTNNTVSLQNVRIELLTA